MSVRQRFALFSLGSAITTPPTPGLIPRRGEIGPIGAQPVFDPASSSPAKSQKAPSHRGFRRFQQAENPAEVQDVAAELEIPTRLAQQILQVLFDAHILTEIAGNSSYTPARPLESITVHNILFAMRSCCAEAVVHPNYKASSEVLDEFWKVENAERAVASPITLLSLIQRTQKPA